MKTQNTSQTTCVCDQIAMDAFKQIDRAFRWAYYALVIIVVFALSLLINSFSS